MPSLTLGEAFVPGSDEKHFCKPTDVAVSSSGIFFVSDGYCNKRIMKFDPTGRLLDVYTGAFNIVHSVTLMEEKDALCVADREHSRIVCIHAGLKQGPGQPTFGSPYGSAGHKGKNVGRVFAVAAKGTEIKPPVNSPRAKEKNTTALTTQTLVKYPHADGHFFSFCVSQASSSTLFSDPFSWACLTARHSTWIV